MPRGRDPVSAHPDDRAGHEASRIAAEPGDHLGDLGRLGDVVVPRRCHEGAHVVGDPAGVGHRGMDDVGRDAERGQLRRRRHRVVLEGCLGGAVGHLLREALRPADVSPTTRPTSAAADVPTGQLADEQRGGTRIDAEVAVDGRRRDRREVGPRRSVGSGVNVSATRRPRC